jgi:hypothetical protein
MRTTFRGNSPSEREIEIYGKVGADDAAAHVAVSQLKNPQFEHRLVRGGILMMLDDAGHSLLALLEHDDHDRGCGVNHQAFPFRRESRS